MALSRRGIASFVSLVSGRKSPKFQHNFGQIVAIQKQYEDGRRHLFSSENLGLENYHRQKSSLVERTGLLKEKFYKRMEEYMAGSDNSTIFTDDVKTMVYFTESDSELNTGIKMLKRFHQQNNDLRFSNFIFGPLVMRLMHVLNKADLAFELFSDENLTGMFDQMSSFVILMDLLYENKQYERVLEVMEKVKDLQLNGYKHPMDCVTLAIAACYKLNTGKSLETVENMLKDIKVAAASVSMRASIFAAMLALKQGKADVALEMLSTIYIRQNRNLPIAYANAKMLVSTSLGRLEESVDCLKTIVQQDVPQHMEQGGEVFAEVLDTVRAAVAKHGGKELIHQLEITEKALKSGNHISAGETFEEYIERPILRQRKLQDGYKQRERSPVGGFQRMHGNNSYRPGLLD